MPRDDGASRASRSAGFANVSNHPVTSWFPAQTEAALALGFGEPFDAPWRVDDIDPNDTEAAVALRVRSLCVALTAAGVRGAHVAGDLTFTFALVTALRAQSVRCFASTSRRLVTEHIEGRVTRSFEFVRWREYR